MPRERLLNINEASEFLALHPQSVRKLCKEGRLPYLLLPGGQYRFEQSALRFDLAQNAANHEASEDLAA